MYSLARTVEIVLPYSDHILMVIYSVHIRAAVPEASSGINPYLIIST